MKRIVFSYLTLSLAFLILSQSVSVAQSLRPIRAERVGMSSERLERLTETMQGYVDDGKLAGAVTLVARRGRTAYFEAVGYRDAEARDLMEEDDIFRIASQTKALVSVCAMILQEEGKLLITDPVGKYLPEFQQTTVTVPNDNGGHDVVPVNRPITIRDLLTHTAGIDYGHGPVRDQWQAAEIQGWYFAHRDEPVRETIARMAALPNAAQPGERWVYGYSTDILGALLERASGQPLDELLQSKLFGPLKMTDTHFYLPLSKSDRFTVVYSANGTGIEPAPDLSQMNGQGGYVSGPRKSFSGGAGGLSTAMDYARFLQMMLDQGELDGTRVLSRKSVELMTTDHLGDISFRIGEGFGLGFSVVKDVGARGTPGSVGEFGWGGAYHSTYWVDPAEELVVVYMTQLSPTGDIDDHGKLRTLIYQAIID